MLSHYRTHCARRRHFGLLRHALTEVSGRERRIALRYHPCRKVGNEVQAFQGHDACRHQVAGGEEAVLQVSRHRLLARRDCRQVLHLYAQHDVEQQQHVEAHEVEGGYYGVKQSRNKSKEIHVIALIHRYFNDLISFIFLTVKNLFLVHFCCTFVTRNKIIFITLTSEKPEWGHKIETNKSI